MYFKRFTKMVIFYLYFEFFFVFFDIFCNAEDLLLMNMFNIKSIEFDSNRDFYAINDIIIAEHQLTD